MAGWVLVVRELYERGPLSIRQFRPQFTSGMQREISPDLYRAVKLGLVHPHGRGGASGRPYKLTPMGVAFAEGRQHRVVLPFKAPNGRGRAPGSAAVFRPTWLASLPATNEIRL